MTARTFFTALPAQDRMRLDVFVAVNLAPEYSRSQAARMIKAGLVTINGVAARASSAVRAGDRIEVAPAPVRTPGKSGRTVPEVEILFADAEMIVVNKPAGLTVHPAPGHPDATLVDAMLTQFPELSAMAEPDGVMRPGIVHRLDKETSGVMVIARTPFARASLSRQFKERTTRKIYIAIVRGVVARDRMTIARSIGRHPTERKRMSVSSRSPRAAVSHLLVLKRFPARERGAHGATLVRMAPETGRTHQIRVHLASIGHPCLGDSLYGSARADAPEFSRHALHALSLGLSHPRSGATMHFTAPMPPDFSSFLAARSVDTSDAALRLWIAAP